ncbi:DUF4920 domain-containing protein [Thalassomonas actiniarum]|uniref:DUF4920 domain-containing protein n=1 Tax=Thalassomonas actiniarum TaxID=485447 RepID=A0AAE9YTN4_9GAMM|nr:DUF4920 domain-containing protein [Thalassomonas actiniarum]WDD99302.1 DUF4920 domain-containing protein [Thalassomonas actiniarum]
MKLFAFKKRLVLLMLLASWQGQAGEATFGSGADMDKLVEVSTLLASPEKYQNEASTISGKVVKVCKKRGCWMDLATDKKYQTLTIKVPDGKMVFPMSAVGKTAYATGTLSERKLDVAQTREYLAHRAQENQTRFDPASVSEGMTVYRFSPQGVTLSD